MQIEWIGSSRRDSDNIQAEPSRLVNCYRENLGSKFVLKAVPGTVAFAQLGGVFTRAMREVGGNIITANGGTLFRTVASGVTAILGEIIDSAQTSISSNNGVTTVAAGGEYYTHDGTLATPDTGVFSDVGSATFIGQRTIITELNGRQLAWSDVADPATFDGFNFATAEQRDDNILRAVAIGGQLVVFKEDSIERWYTTGATDPVDFIRYVPGSLTDIGLKAFGLYTDVPNGGFFIGTDNIVYLYSGGSMKPVSSRGVETAIEQGNPDYCFYYEAEGHKFCAVRFGDRPSWVYDISMDEWHERAEGTRLEKWSAVAAVKAFGGFYVGTLLGGVFRLAQVNRDTDGPLIREATSGNLRNGGRYFRFGSMELLGTIGFSDLSEGGQRAFVIGSNEDTAVSDGEDAAILAYIETTPARPAIVTLKLSKDRGVTWGVEKPRGLGLLGQYDVVTKWRQLGTMRNACVKITTAEESEISFEAVADVEIS